LRAFPPQISPYLRLGLRWPEGFKALRYRNFRLFFFGQLISLIGVWMQSTAQQWLVYRLTGSQLKLGMVVFAGFLPVLLLSLFMGVIVDRLPRRALLLITQSWFTIGAAVLALLSYLDVIQYQHIILLAILMGIGNALDMPARQAFYTDLVKREDLMNAIALNSSVFNGARIIGPAIGGFIVARLGEAPAFSINAVSYFAVIAGLLLMRLPPFDHPNSEEKGFDSLLSGVHYLFRHKEILGLVAMIALFSIIGFPYLVLLPVIAQDVLRTGANGFGNLMAAQGVGALIGALSLALRGDSLHKGRLLIASRMLMALSIIGLALAMQPIFAFLALVVAGFAFISQLALTNTLIQLLVLDELRGRVISSYTWALGGFYPLGSLLIGSIGDHLGATNALIGTGVGTVLLTLLGLAFFPEAKNLT
jgi:MFS family permease